MNMQEVNHILDAAAMFPKKPGLANMRAILDALGHPEAEQTFVHIAGTNGKGSTAVLMAAALKAAGHRTGLFTSPYITRFHERIVVDGNPISDEALCKTLQWAWPRVRTLEPTFFELVTALGLLHFAKEGCTVTVLETGLGGRLDPTNAIPCPAVAVIARIGLDHTAVLGHTIEEIAGEKAGIIKPGGLVALLRQGDGAQDPVRAACEKQGATLFVTPQPDYGMAGNRAVLHTPEGPLTVGLMGRYQGENGLLAYTALSLLRKRGFIIPFAAVREGFLQAVWPGRFERLREKGPAVVLDGAHNPLGVEALMASLLTAFPEHMGRVVMVVGMMGDKDVGAAMAAAVPYAATVFAVPIPEPRAITPEALCAVVNGLGGRAAAASSLKEGVERALRVAGEDGVVCIFGSLHQCGPARQLF